MHEELYKKGNFQNGRGVTLEYRFIQFKDRNQFASYLVGGFANVGEGCFTVEVTYKDIKGKKIGRVQVEGKVNAGFLGGSFREAHKTAVHEIVHYTKDVLHPNN